METEKTVVTLKVPDYSRIPLYDPTDEEQAAMGVGTVAELVALYNVQMLQLRRPPLTCYDYPNSSKKLARLIKRFADIHAARKAA
jgi:sortase (surface protein transpeptidase)